MRLSNGLQAIQIKNSPGLGFCAESLSIAPLSRSPCSLSFADGRRDPGSRSAKVYEGSAGKPRFCLPQRATRTKRSRVTNGLAATKPRILVGGQTGLRMTRQPGLRRVRISGVLRGQSKNRPGIAYVRPFDGLAPRSNRRSNRIATYRNSAVSAIAAIRCRQRQKGYEPRAAEFRNGDNEVP
jgi:hypothetical protein